jgi:hypothetical protein
MAVDNAHSRRRIEQLVSNAFPGCSAEFVATNPGALAFRICGPTGRHRSGIIRLPSHGQSARLNAAWLERTLKRAARKT